MARRKGGLGKGLDALFADAAPITPEVSEQQTSSDATDNIDISNIEIDEKGKKANQGELYDVEDRVVYIDINDIKPNDNQPRTNFNQEKLVELANSITENGVIQPLIVRKKEQGYELVAGERRWRASRIAGLKTVPCIIREFDEKQNMIVAIIENMQREDLDPIDEAMGIKQMIDKFKFTQEQVSASLGKSRAYIANSTRLLKLPEEIRKYISEGVLSAAHGRTIVAISDKKKQLALAEKVVKEGLSVRATERIAEAIKNGDDEKKPKKKEEKKSSEIIVVEEELRSILGTRVNIERNRKKKGTLQIEFYSDDELNRIIDLMRKLDK